MQDREEVSFWVSILKPLATQRSDKIPSILTFHGEELAILLPNS
jgi:hypothetical protein